MKELAIAACLTVFATVAQADLLARWEAAEEAIQERVFTMYGNPQAYQPWTDQTRRGKACLLSALEIKFGARRVEGYVAHLEGTAARRMAYLDVRDLNMDWARAATSNRIWIERAGPLAQACGSSF